MEQQTLWLVATNIALGAVVAICGAVIAVGVAKDLIARSRRQRRLSAELDRDLRELVAEFEDRVVTAREE